MRCFKFSLSLIQLSFTEIDLRFRAKSMCCRASTRSPLRALEIRSVVHMEPPWMGSNPSIRSATGAQTAKAIHWVWDGLGAFRIFINDTFHATLEDLVMMTITQ